MTQRWFNVDQYHRRWANKKSVFSQICVPVGNLIIHLFNRSWDSFKQLLNDEK